MVKNVLAICGEESGYIRRLYEYVLPRYKEDFEVILFTRKESAFEYFSKNIVEIAIVEENFKNLGTENVRHLVVLSEKAVPDEAYEVFKYLSCDKIMKDAMAICAAGIESGCEKNDDRSKKLIGVYSPVKRVFQTTFAVTLGQILAKDKKVLYLNFENFSGFETICRASDRKDLMDLVYFSECKSENFAYRVESMKESIGKLDYISPAKTFLKYGDVTKKQWEALINNLLTKTDYEYIILDLSELVNGLLEILMKCDIIYTIIDEDRVAAAKVVQYENMLRQYSYEEILKKTKNITLPKFKGIPSELEMLTYTELAGHIRKLCGFGEKEDRDESVT